MKPCQAAALVGCASVVGLAAVAATLTRGRRADNGRELEAIARMLASENPHGSARLWTEQLWTQQRNRGRGSWWQTLTGGLGWGPQGGARPVATTEPPTERGIRFAAEFLSGAQPSALPTARRFFEPATQDRVFAVAEEARRKRALGQTLTRNENRLLGYHSDAADIRRRWRAEGKRWVDTIEGVEFWT